MIAKTEFGMHMPIQMVQEEALQVFSNQSTYLQIIKTNVTAK
jgi:hypothetical protein